jgi:hypothetical protein
VGIRDYHFTVLDRIVSLNVMRTEAINLDTGNKWEDSLFYIVGNGY